MEKAEELLTDYCEIHSANMAYYLINDLKFFLKKGLIKQISGNCSIFDISFEKSFPDDLINIEFETIPGKTKYLLNFETYHGCGGVFKKI